MKLFDKMPAWSLSLFGALLLWISWAPLSFNFLLPFAFIPWILLVLKLHNDSKLSKAKWYLLLGIVFWNLLCTWWVAYADFYGAIMMLVANSLLMILPWGLFTYALRKKGRLIGFLMLIVAWMSFEFMHYNWESHFPWLNLGNGFAKSPWMVQWYEYTGVLGGSLWVLITSILFSNLIYKRKWSWTPVFIYFIPIIISLSIYVSYQEEGEKKEVVILQPNLDPFEEKFDLGANEISELMVGMAQDNCTDSTALLVLPETAIVGFTEESHFKLNKKVQILLDFLEDHKELSILSGAETYSFIYADKQPTPASRMDREGVYYEKYNTAVLLTRHEEPQFYHKSKLVPGPETVPFLGFFKSLEKINIKLPGGAGILGVSEEPKVFNAKQGIKVAPLICYESVFGDYTTKYINKGANLLSIITNDGWWRETDGHRHHLYYGALRAIETRKHIARSANTGISAIINQRGEIVDRTSWWKREVLKGFVLLNNKITFYVKYGDYLGWISFISLVAMLVFTFFTKKSK